MISGRSTESRCELNVRVLVMSGVGIRVIFRFKVKLRVTVKIRVRASFKDKISLGFSSVLRSGYC